MLYKGNLRKNRKEKKNMRTKNKTLAIGGIEPPISRIFYIDRTQRPRQTRHQPRKPGSFTSARRYSKDPGALWSREPPDFRGNSNCRLFAI